MNNYILDENGEPKICHDIHAWGRWFENNPNARIVAQARVKGCLVSTVFLGLDHSWQSNTPILWETMIFAPVDPSRLGNEIFCDRCSGSREQAEQMHTQGIKWALDNITSRARIKFFFQRLGKRFVYLYRKVNSLF